MQCMSTSISVLIFQWSAVAYPLLHSEAHLDLRTSHADVSVSANCLCNSNNTTGYADCSLKCTSTIQPLNFSWFATGF